MGADLSRVRFDARRDITKVVQQQGRVLLDADGNEQTDVLDRRLRAQAADLGSYGPTPDVAGTAVIPRTTPDAFRLAFAGSALTLGRGRMYVDGLLAENHGTGAEELDPLLAETRGTAATPYLAQPYLPSPDPVPTTGRHLVYLEVREREITAVEEPDLVDEAIAVDTTARVHVVWQARIHAPNAPGLTCATPDDEIPGWAAVIAPSSSRLTVDTVPVPAATNPCSLPPSGDYRGLENQTYRVEIHTGGAPGGATFKWSRENASVTIPVTELSSPTRFRLASLGKDAESLGLASGQWVELLDDDHELTGRPGEMRQVTVHPEDRSVSFTGALPAGWPSTSADAVDRHLRVRRWDGAGGTATIPGGSTAVELEHGITVALSAGSGTFRTGEHWIFAARTATTSVEKLTDAPPLGPHRHYARLGIIEGTTVVSDQCAPLWPAECSCEDDCACTVCVSPEEHASGALTLQDALDQVTPTGGTVCLEVGTYQLEEPLRLADAAGVRLRGQGSATILTTRSDGLVVERSADTTVEDLAIVSSGGPGEDPLGTVPTAAVRLLSCFGTTLQRLTLVVEGEGRACGVALHDLCATTRVLANDVTAPVGILAGSDVKLPLLVDDLTVADNTLACATTGVLADDATLYTHDCHVHRNRVEADQDAGIRLGGVVGDGALVRVEANHVSSSGHGVVVTAGATVTDNTVTSPGTRGDEPLVGVTVAASPLPGTVATTVTDNTVSGFDRGCVVATSGEPVRVEANRLTRCGNGVAITALAAGADVQVVENLVLDIAEEEGTEQSVFGVFVGGAGTLLVSGNTVGRVGHRLKSEDPVVGIGVFGVLTSRLSANEVYAVGPPDAATRTYDYAVSGTVAATISDNQSLHDLDTDGQAAWGLRLTGAGRLSSPTKAAFLGAASAGTAVYATDDLLLVQALVGRETSVLVDGNTFTGGFLGAAVEARVGGTVLLSHNHCTTPPDIEGAVRVQAETAAVTGNRVQGGSPSMDLVVDPKRLTVLGNLVSNGITASGGLDPTWVPLNMDGVS